MKKVILVDIVPEKKTTKEQLLKSMQELEELVLTYWWIVIIKKIQKKQIPDYKFYVGKWKLEEIIELMKIKDIDLLIIWNILKPLQIYNINSKLESIGKKAWDRIDLILKIFEKHANSVESKLQIELAAIKHMWPRIFGMGLELSRQWWGIWTRWIWETNIEIMKRHLLKKEKIILSKLEHCKKVRNTHRISRKKKNLQTVWIVWYTNAWKSTLINSLTKKKTLVENKLFATLGTLVGYMHVDTNNGKWEKILINDTIWFIRDLPPSLINAFSSTLEDSTESDLLLHVVDCTWNEQEEKIQVVDNILKDIWVKQDIIYIFNKIDLISLEKLGQLKINFWKHAPIFISAEKKIWLDNLKKQIIKRLYNKYND